MVRAALVVSIAHRARACARGFVRALPAQASASADGDGAGKQPFKRAGRSAAGAAALVCDALVVSARWRGEHAAVHDTGWRDHACDAKRHDAAAANDTGGYDAATAAVGHVFCLSAPVRTVRGWRRGGQSRVATSKYDRTEAR